MTFRIKWIQRAGTDYTSYSPSDDSDTTTLPMQIPAWLYEVVPVTERDPLPRSPRRIMPTKVASLQRPMRLPGRA